MEWGGELLPTLYQVLEIIMNLDAVLIGSVASVVLAVVVFGYVIFKVGRLMKQDGGDNK